MSAVIELRDITLLRNNALLLEGATMYLSGQERLAIIGPNGSGKTTLLRSIMGFVKPQHGQLRLFGENCTDERHFRQQRPRIGFLFQDSDDQLFCPTVIDDVVFGPLNIGCTPSEAMERARGALADLGILHVADRVAHRLSGGEKRLVCLAGLLAMRPDILLLDEPTNGIDADNGERLRTALRAFPGAMLLVSHDDAFVAELATRAMIIEDRKLLPAEIHSHPHLHAHAHVHGADLHGPDGHGGARS